MTKKEDFSHLQEMRNMLSKIKFLLAEVIKTDFKATKK